MAAPKEKATRKTPQNKPIKNAPSPVGEEAVFGVCTTLLRCTD